MSKFYQIGPQRYDDQFWWKKDDLEFWKKQLNTKSEDSILELGAGTARIGSFLYEANPNYRGIDISKDYVAFANAKLINHFQKNVISRQDMRKFNFSKIFQHIFIGFNSFFHLLSESDVSQTLSCVRKHMNKKSDFYIDIFNPNPSIFHNQEKKVDILEFLDSERRCESKIQETVDYDYQTNLVNVLWCYVDDRNITYERFKFNMKIYYPDTMNRLLIDNGFIVKNLWGSYAKEKFCEESEKQIYRCKLA